MNRGFVPGLLFIGFFMLYTAQTGWAEFYQYADDKGVVSITDNLQSIPEKYRAGAVIVGGTTGTAIIPPGAVEKQEISGPEQKAVPVQGQHRTFTFRLLLSLAIVCLGAVSIAVLSTVQLPERRKKHLPRIRTALISALSVYLLIAHAGDLLTLLGKAWGTVERAKEESVEKGRNAARAIKAMDALRDGTVQDAEQPRDR